MKLAYPQEYTKNRVAAYPQEHTKNRVALIVVSWHAGWEEVERKLKEKLHRHGVFALDKVKY